MSFEQAYKFVMEKFKKEKRDIAHDFTHIQRVLKNAEWLAKEENADLETVRFAALFHDIYRPIHDDKQDHAEASAKRVENYLRKYAPLNKIKMIQHCIATHSETSKTKPQTLEAKIIWDADKLDVLGEIGVIRWAVHLGSVGANPCLDAYQTAKKSIEKTKKALNSLHTAAAKKKGEEIAERSFEILTKILDEKDNNKKSVK
jgi:uncharacterized protein